MTRPFPTDAAAPSVPARRHIGPLARTVLSMLGSTATIGAAAQTLLPPVEVIRVTPVPGLSVPRDQVPGNVQTASDLRLKDAQSLNMPDFLAGRMPSVTANEIQGNPYQLDVNYRGFTASPLLGTPQGLSVFVDGVRVNEPFGDVVNWDLIPRNALASITLMPGSNPLFGLNTLGGALSLTTKSGQSHPGSEAELSAGSFGRRSVEASHGRHIGAAHHLFLSGSAFEEDGWRDASPSRVQQLFAKLGGDGGPLGWELGASLARTRLIGNGPTPDAMLAQRRAQVYTTPDITENEALIVNLQANWKLGAQQSLSGNVYVRRVHTDTLNGDLNDDYDPPTTPESAVENRTESRQRAFGATLQFNHRDGRHNLAAGVSYDRARTNFEQTEAEGRLDARRGVVPTEDEEVNALIHGRTATASLFATDTITLNPATHLTVSGRYNRTRVQTIDDGRALLGLPTLLDSDHRYNKLNPAAGVTWKAAPRATVYGGWSQGNRAPSPIELGCSDPANPCVLPNALQSDPPLRQVVSRTVEFGVRGTADGLRWNASAYSTTNRDDILFVSNSLAAGYFTNFGRTRRQGIELDAAGSHAGVEWSVAYGFLKATYESPACIVAEANSTAETSPACTGDDEVEVRAGDRIPGLPRHSVKLDLAVRPLPTLRVGAQLAAYSGQFVRGNENNRHAPDGVEYFGSGALKGYEVLNLTGEWSLAPGWELLLRANNVLNRRYASGGLLGENAFDAAGALQPPADWRHEQFSTPGAPRSAWIGLRWRLGGR